MDEREIFDRVQRWGGLGHRRDAEHAVRTTLRALREQLYDDEAQGLLADLPPELVPIFAKGSRRASCTLHEFYERVATLEDVPLPFATEHAQAVCEALGALLPAPSIARLTRALPEFAPLFTAIDREPHEPRLRIHPPSATTLAEGRPGSAHTLSEAQPSTTPRRGRP